MCCGFAQKKLQGQRFVAVDILIFIFYLSLVRCCFFVLFLLSHFCAEIKNLCVCVSIKVRSGCRYMDNNNNNNNNNNNHDNVYRVVIMTEVKARVHPVQSINVD